ncbi:CaiB/BaiF CoA transferase family protein [Elioraea rosea]|uniref:CaiB/BaiF CoA transferase family protein n=1 Tax=Elioraea rosea TaxID=2492390 RepID=UPI001185CFB7|nr:CoA transferase [Elioraea rosea]
MAEAEGAESRRDSATDWATEAGGDSAPRGPLAGLKILELGHYIAGPFCTRILADLGAEVIKLEPPGGDPFRGWGSALDGNSVWWSIHGRNKLCAEVDLKHAQGKEAVRRLAARADVLVENFRPGYLERLGLGPEALRALNPRLVVARISGYGQDGPYRDKPAFGAIGEAMGGIRHLTGHPPGMSDLPPPRAGISIADDLAGLYAAIGLLAACWRRDVADPSRGGGVGAVIDVSLVESVFSLMEGMLPEYGLFGKVRQPAGAAIPTAAPTNTYPTKDGGWIVIAGNSDPIYRRLMALIGRPELAADPRLATNAGRCAHVGEIDAAIAAWTKGLDAKEADRLLEEAEVPACRLYSIRDCAEDPHFRSRRAVQEVEDPLLGRVLHPGPALRVDSHEPDAVVGWTGPAVGAHNGLVLERLAGLDAEAAASARGEERAG